MNRKCACLAQVKCIRVYSSILWSRQSSLNCSQGTKLSQLGFLNSKRSFIWSISKALTEGKSEFSGNRCLSAFTSLTNSDRSANDKRHFFSASAMCDFRVHCIKNSYMSKRVSDIPIMS